MDVDLAHAFENGRRLPRHRPVVTDSGFGVDRDVVVAVGAK